VVVDGDAKGKIAGIDIQHASEASGLATFEADSLPGRCAARAENILAINSGSLLSGKPRPGGG
jgi:hypothetical protein